MKLGVFTILFNDWSFEDTVRYVKAAGIEMVEIGTGGYSKSAHMDPKEVVKDKDVRKRMMRFLDDQEIKISALSAHGNPLHPDSEIAKRHHAELQDTILAAEALGVDTVLVMSGCPGGSPQDKTPNWAVAAWPEDFSGILEYQWNGVLIPYWTKMAAFAKDHRVTKIAVEPHPGFCVYNAETMRRLRDSVGEVVGVNIDPSHLFWQGMDPCAVIEELSDCIFHFHAKDSAILPGNAGRNGVLDPKGYENMKKRSWNFRTVGYGHPEEIWKSIMSALASAGYDYAISIEHEDSLMDREEGFGKAVEFLKRVMIKKRPEKMWWETRPEG